MYQVVFVTPTSCSKSVSDAMSSKITIRGLTAWASIFDTNDLSLLVNTSVTLAVNLEVSSLTTSVRSILHILFTFFFRSSNCESFLTTSNILNKYCHRSRSLFQWTSSFQSRLRTVVTCLDLESAAHSISRPFLKVLQRFLCLKYVQQYHQ